MSPHHERLIAIACMLVAGCGTEDGGETSTVPPPVPAPSISGSVAVPWTEHATFGGVVEAIVRRDHELFVSNGDHDVVRFDSITGEWSETGARAQFFSTTMDGYLFSDRGYRLRPGDHDWERVDAYAIRIGSDGRTLYGLKDLAIPVTSSDYGETWSRLPSLPGPASAILEVNGAVYVSIRQDHQGLWRLPEGATAWEPLPLTELITQLQRVPGGGIVAARRSWPDNLYWSVDGSNWSQLTYSGEELVNPVLSGLNENNELLVTADRSLYTLNADGVLTEVLQVPPSQPTPLWAASLDDADVDYIAGDGGIWRLKLEDLGAGSEHIGLPGDHAGRLFHLSSGTFANIDGALHRFDALSNTWQRFALGCCSVLDIEELADGELLLLAAYGEEASHGAVFLRKANGEIETLMQGPQMASSVVTDTGQWLVTSSPWVDTSNYQVLASSDSGNSWASVTPAGIRVVEVERSCGETLAASDRGLWRYENGSWTRRGDASEPLVGLATRDNQAVAYTASQIWYRADCSGRFRPIGFPAGYAIKSIALDNTGRIWVGTEKRGLVRRADTGEWSWFDEDLPRGEMRVSVDGANEIWVRVVGKGVYSGHPK